MNAPTKYQTPELVISIAADLRGLDAARNAEHGYDVTGIDTPAGERERLREAHRLAAEQTGAMLDDYGRVVAQ